MFMGLQPTWNETGRWASVGMSALRALVVVLLAGFIRLLRTVIHGLYAFRLLCTDRNVCATFGVDGEVLYVESVLCPAPDGAGWCGGCSHRRRPPSAIYGL